MIRRLPLRRRRPADPVAGAGPAPLPSEPVTSPPGSEPTAVPPAHPAAPIVVAPDPLAPAGLEVGPEPPRAAPSFKDRGRLRRRLRYLRRVRELGFRDLGGLVFDLHRFGRDGGHLVQGKLESLSAVDVELRALETVLEDRHDVTVLREPGIAACPRCAALHGSDANFCPNCGLAFSGPQSMATLAEPGGVAPQPAPPDAVPDAPPWTEDAPTSVQRAVPPGPGPGQGPGAP